MRIGRLLTRAAVACAVGAAAMVNAPVAGAAIGGIATSPSAHPYFARVISTVTPGQVALCGGSVIDREWVLTAAHCVAGTRGTDVELSDGKRIDATERLVHPLWDGKAEDGHDLALLRIPPTDIAPIQVGDPADADSFAADRPATMIGRGRAAGSRRADGSLRVVAVPLRSDTDMLAIYPWNVPLTIGAGTPTHTICHGDSGGPLTVTNHGRRIQVGVASFITAQGCAQPAGYAELSNAQLAWVAKHVPSQQARWGACAGGQWRAEYDDPRTDPNAERDGPYLWNVACVGPA